MLVIYSGRFCILLLLTKKYELRLLFHRRSIDTDAWQTIIVYGYFAHELARKGHISVIYSEACTTNLAFEGVSQDYYINRIWKKFRKIRYVA